MTKLDNDAASVGLRPSAAAPSKAAVPPPTVYDPKAPSPFAAFFELPAVKAALPPDAVPPTRGTDSVPAPSPGQVSSASAAEGLLSGFAGLTRTNSPGSKSMTSEAAQVQCHSSVPVHSHLQL